MRRLFPLLLACLILAPASLALAADTGDTSPSYGGQGGGDSGGSGGSGGGAGVGNAPDTTAPFVGLAFSIKHLASLAHSGKLALQVVVSENCKVKLSGHASVGSRHEAFKPVTVKLTKGLNKVTLKLSAKHRKALAHYVRKAKKSSRAAIALSGTATDGAGNRRHLSLAKKLKA